MKAISLWQPWASLWLSPAKRHETRHWRTNVRGLVLVHAAKKRINRAALDRRLVEIVERQLIADNPCALPTGALIGVVNLVDCEATGYVYPVARDDLDDWHCGDFAPGRFAWRRAQRYLRFAAPIPYRGAQGFFFVPDDVVKPQLEQWLAEHRERT